MKKIKKLFQFIAAKLALGDSFMKFAFLVIAITLSSTASALTNYCGTARSSTTPTTAYTLNYTCKNVSGTTYQMILDFPTTVTSADNINIGANPGPTNVGASPVFSNGNKTLTLQFTTATTPTLYVGIIFVTISGVQVRWDLPLDANFATTCPPAAPSLTTTAATAVTGTTATLNGNISYNGGSSITDYGFYWSTTNGFANGTGTLVQLGTTNFTGNITSNLTGLNYSTPYYYKAYATNSLGTTYGTQQTFTTISQFPPPTLGSPTATAITNNSATLGATILTVGSPVYTARGTSYKTATGVVATDNQLSDGTNTGATGAYSHSRTGLSPQQQYFYVGYGTNTTGTAISAEGNFRTQSNPPTVQPTTFTTTAAIASLVANWNAASFPASGASNAGYIVVYSTGTPTFTAANGTAPAGAGTLVNVGNTVLPAAPALTTTISGLTAGTVYNLLIVPYTWDGTNTATYSYLTSGARTTTGTPLAVPAPPTPSIAAVNVFSVFSDTYTGAPATLAANVNMYAYGNAASTGTVVLATGNTTRTYTNFLYLGNSFTTVNLTSYVTAHLDVFSSNAAYMKFYLVSTTAGEAGIQFTVTPNTWNSITIPMSSYSTAIKTVVKEIKYTNVNAAGAEIGGGTIYLDNVYFDNLPVLVAPTISNFPAIGKVMGDPAFNLTNPTSNSSGAWTYTIAPAGVATISGNIVTLVAAGTATITASQAANGSFTAGSITATLTVAASQVPLTGPTTPIARNAWDVKSIYGSAYTNQPGVTFDSFGTSAVIADFTLADASVVKKYTLHSYSGIQLIAATGLDVATASSGMTTLHMDVWSPNFSSMNVKLEAFNGSNVELGVPGGTSQYSWKSYDIPLSSYSAVDLAHLKYIVPVTYGQNATLYITNVYFYRPATAQQPPTISGFTVPSQVVGAADFNLTQPTSNSIGAWTYSSGTPTVATVTGTLVHIVGAGTATITATQAAAGSYAAGSTTATLAVTPPAAPTPIARNTWDVISLYSDSYATSSSASWGGAGTGVTISGNNTRYLSGSPQYRLAFTSTDVSAMTYLHIDVYALNQSTWQFRLNDKAVTKSTPVNGWTSVDILLSDFVTSGLNLASVSYFDFFNPNGANPNSSYLDNIYFYRAATDLPPVIGALTVPTPQVLGNAPFTLTNPTSPSSGAWTYSSSPAGVVTFSGNVATIVGGGTTTITASQAAVPGVYGPASTTASLVVTYPAPGPSPVPPVRDPAKVVSMYTGTPAVYTNAITATQASWSTGSTATNFSYSNGTNTCIQVNNLGYVGIVASTGTFSALGMTYLHVDVYLNSPISNLFVVLVSTAADKLYNTGALVTGWNSLDINLATAFPGAPLATLYGLKFEQNVGSARQIYLDNIYFDIPCTTPTATIVSNGGSFCPGSNATFTVNGTEGSTLNYTITGQVGTQQLALTGVNQTITAVAPSTDVSLNLLTVTNTSCVTTTSSSTFATGSSSVLKKVEINFNNIDDDCDGSKFNGHAPVVVDITTADGVLSSLNTPIENSVATNTTPYIDAPQVTYKYKVTKTNAPTSVAYVTSDFLGFFFSSASNVAFASTYTVQATAIVNGEEQPYNGSTATFSTLAAPTIDSAAIASDNANPAYAKSGNTITLTFTTSQTPNSDPVVTIGGETVTAIGSGTSWSATKAVTGSDANGLVSFSISIVDDLANTISRTTTTNSSSVTIDNTTPATPTITGGPTTFCSGGSVVLTSSAGTTYLWSTGATTASITVSTSGNYTVQVSSPVGTFSLASAVTTVIVTAQPEWFADVDGDGYSSSSIGSTFSCTRPVGYKLASELAFGGVGSTGTDCDDTVAGPAITPAATAVSGTLINPGRPEICYNNVDDNCSGAKSEGCAAVPVTVYNPGTITNFGGTIECSPYSYPGSTTIAYRLEIERYANGVSTGAPVTLPTQSSRFFSIPVNMRAYTTSTTVTTYKLRASAVINGEIVAYARPVITVNSFAIPTIQLSSCPTVLTTVGGVLAANTGFNATDYSFRLRLDNTSTYYYNNNSASRFINVNSFSGYQLEYGKTYKVSVNYNLLNNGVLTAAGWGAECDVTTPSIPLCSLGAPVCGSQVTSFGAAVTANPASYADRYKFRIRLTSDNTTPTYYYTAELTSRFSQLSAFQGLTLSYNTPYSISVQYRLPNNGSPLWSDFGPECSVSTPFYPTVAIDCSSGVTALTQSITFGPYTGGGFPPYKIRLYELDINNDPIVSTVQYITRTSANFTLSMFTTYPPTVGKNYSADVAVVLNGIDTEYGRSCTILTILPGGRQSVAIKQSFKATAYPNPFANNFMLDVKTSSQSVVNLKVYDMVGRLIEQQDVSVSDLETSTIGDRYPSGVYNVVVSQEDDVQMVRVVKR